MLQFWSVLLHLGLACFMRLWEVLGMENQQTDALVLLRQKLEEAKIRNSSWSQRAFAKKLGLSSGALSEIMTGKRPLSMKARKKIIDRLQLSPDERRRLLADEI